MLCKLNEQLKVHDGCFLRSIFLLRWRYNLACFFAGPLVYPINWQGAVTIPL